MASQARWMVEMLDALGVTRAAVDSIRQDYHRAGCSSGEITPGIVGNMGTDPL